MASLTVPTRALLFRSLAWLFGVCIGITVTPIVAMVVPFLEFGWHVLGISTWKRLGRSFAGLGSARARTTADLIFVLNEPTIAVEKDLADSFAKRESLAHARGNLTSGSLK